MPEPAFRLDPGGRAPRDPFIDGMLAQLRWHEMVDGYTGDADADIAAARPIMTGWVTEHVAVTVLDGSALAGAEDLPTLLAGLLGLRTIAEGDQAKVIDRVGVATTLAVMRREREES